MFIQRVKFKPLPMPTGLLLFAFGSVAWTAATLAQLAGVSPWWAALVAIPATPALYSNARLACYYNRIARLCERYAETRMERCPRCERKPVLHTVARGKRVNATIICQCGHTLGANFKTRYTGPEFHSRVLGIDRICSEWNSEEYRTRTRERTVPMNVAV